MSRVEKWLVFVRYNLETSSDTVRVSTDIFRCFRVVLETRILYFVYMRDLGMLFGYLLPMVIKVYQSVSIGHRKQNDLLNLVR